MIVGYSMAASGDSECMPPLRRMVPKRVRSVSRGHVPLPGGTMLPEPLLHTDLITGGTGGLGEGAVVERLGTGPEDE